jgi:hypothetical protein
VDDKEAGEVETGHICATALALQICKQNQRKNYGIDEQTTKKLMK